MAQEREGMNVVHNPSGCPMLACGLEVGAAGFWELVQFPAFMFEGLCFPFIIT